MLATWLSPDDAGRLFEACLTAPAPGFRVIYGVSANTRGGWVSLDGAHALGYEARDDAEVYAAGILARPARQRRRFRGPGARRPRGRTRPTRCSAISAARSRSRPGTPPIPPVLAGA